MILGSLRAQLLYPATPQAVSEATLRRMLARCIWLISRPGSGDGTWS